MNSEDDQGGSKSEGAGAGESPVSSGPEAFLNSQSAQDTEPIAPAQHAAEPWDQPSAAPAAAGDPLVAPLATPLPAAAAIIDVTKQLPEERKNELRALFKGVAVVIDDEIHDTGSQISRIVEQIEKGGGKVVKMPELPPDDYDYGNFAGVSFFVLDWQLTKSLDEDQDGQLARTAQPSGLAKREQTRKINFLLNIMQHRLAPVFIFTSSDLEPVREALAEKAELYSADEHSHIMVHTKAQVIADEVFNVLTDWMHQRPSAYVLKTWEREYDRAKNAMFKDLYTKSVDWPVLLWRTFDGDGLPASDELGRLITRIIFSRMTPFHMDLSPWAKDKEEQSPDKAAEYQKKLLAVLESERFVPEEGLHGDSVAPGDVFKLAGQKYAINIRPDCDCIDRGGKGDIELYLLYGDALTPNQLEKKLDLERGLLKDADADVAIFSMYQGRTINFSMKELGKDSWQKLKGQRIGRLLPPYLTRVQQRYAAYLSRPGLPRIPLQALAPKKQA